MASSASTLFSNASQIADEFKLVDTVILGFAVDNALVVGSLSTTTADSNTVDDVALLGLVAKFVGLVSSGGAVNLDNFLGLAVFPCSMKLNNNKKLKQFSLFNFKT